MPVTALQLLFGAVRHGKFFIEIRSFLRIWDFGKIYVPSHDFDAMTRAGYRCSDWISTIPNEGLRPPHSLFGAVLSCDAW
jgi:hypothetical protein